QVLFYSEIAKEQGTFSIDDVLDRLSTKLVDRHPHVFGDVKAETSSDVLRNWEALKAEEKNKRLEAGGGQAPKPSRSPETGIAGSGRQPIAEQLRARLEEEVGDLFFVLVNIARYLSLDPESALKKTNRKFKRRFQGMEDQLQSQGRAPQQADMEELESLWQQAKQQEPANE